MLHEMCCLVHSSSNKQRYRASLVQSECHGVERWRRWYARPWVYKYGPRSPPSIIWVRRLDFNMRPPIIYAKSVCEHSVPVTLMALPSISHSDFVTAPCGWHWHWHYIIYSLLAWQTTMIFWKFWWKSPVRSTRTSHKYWHWPGASPTSLLRHIQRRWVGGWQHYAW